MINPVIFDIIAVVRFFCNIGFKVEIFTVEAYPFITNLNSLIEFFNNKSIGDFC